MEKILIGMGILYIFQLGIILLMWNDIVEIKKGQKDGNSNKEKLPRSVQKK